jgi:hypothetical protein
MKKQARRKFEFIENPNQSYDSENILSHSKHDLFPPYASKVFNLARN